jgi:NDP-sugar pyrophosphorylase family protein
MSNILILAGGEGTRLVGEEYPKALMRLVVKPVVELLTDKILKTNPNISIYVVTKEKWCRDFDRWIGGYRERLKEEGVHSSRINLVFEEKDLDSQLMEGFQGTLPAINGTLQHLINREKIKEDEVFHVLAGDNYFDEDFDGEEKNENDLANFLTASQGLLNKECFCVIGGYKLPDRREAKRFGVIRHDGNWIKELIEKPSDPYPADDLISTGFYAFRNNKDTRNSISKFLTSARRDPRFAKDKVTSVDVAFYIAHRIQEQEKMTSHDHEPLRAKYFECKGAWYDIGTPDSLARATRHFISRNVDAIRTVGDLVKRPHSLVADKFFLHAISHNVKFEEAGNARLTMTIHFDPTDPVYSKKNDGTAGAWIQSVAKLVASKQDQRKALIEEINTISASASKKDRLYLSGGVLLVDSMDPASNPSLTRSRIPLQRRDFGANLDPDRLTMPSGAIDTLSLIECCYAEMQEEMVYYGEAKGSSSRVLYYLRPPNNLQSPLNQEGFLRHVDQKQLYIPGIDPVLLKQALFDLGVGRTLIEEVIVSEHDLSIYHKESHICEVILKLKDEEIERSWFFVSVDEQTLTLECRKIAVANLSNVGESVKGWDPANKLYGKLAGIADGEGFGRLPVLFGADTLIGYIASLDRLSRKEIVNHLLVGPDDLIKILCSGEPGTGRFNRSQFDIPIVTTTKTVGDMLRFLPNMFRR